MASGENKTADDMPSGATRLEDPDVLLSILDNLPSSIFVKDENLNFVFSNQLHCEMIGKPEAELLGKCDGDFYPEADANQYLAVDRRVIDEGRTILTEERVTSALGVTTSVLTRKARLKAPDGKTYLIGTNTDLTEVKKREDQYKVLTETVPVGIVQVAEGGELVFSNPLFIAYCGGDVSGDNGLRVIEKMQETYPHFPGQACRFETDIQGLGGEPRAVIVISSGWLRVDGNKKSAIISVIDISAMTELRRVNAEISRLNRELADNVKKLKEAQDELVKKGKMEQLGQLTATVAHELRNPLGAVRTSAYLLERKLKNHNLGVEVQFERINNGINRCDNTITQLLDFSRTRNLNCESENLDEWLARAVKEEADDLPAAVTINLSLGLDDARIPFDPSRLQRAVVNLLANASEAMVGQTNPNAAKTDNPTIWVSSSKAPDGINLVFKDNGPGMTAEVLNRVREPLFTTKSFGTGLGIPAVEQIAMQHGGTLEITSAPGEGAEFTIFLPAERKVSAA
jgi:PAS domain S-box-containing protein